MRKKIAAKYLGRNPLYLKDYAELEGIEDKQSFDHIRLEAMIKEAWGITSLIHPHNPNIKSSEFAARHRPYRIDKNISQWWKDNRFILVEIDLAKNKSAISKDVHEIVRDWQKLIGELIPEKRQKKRQTAPRKIDEIKVWDLYLIHQSFSKIAKQLNVKQSTVRKAYFKAFERIMGEPYDANRHNKKYVQKEQLQQTCETCSKHATCKVPCPIVLPFISQDEVNQRELPLDTPVQLVKTGRKKGEKIDY